MIRKLDDNPTLRERMERVVVRPIIAAKANVGFWYKNSERVECNHFLVDARTMNVTHELSIADDSIPLSDILLELVLVALVFLFSSITEYAVRKKVLKNDMSERVKRLLPILKRINKLGDRTRRQYVKKCDKKFVDCVSECAKDVLRGNVPLATN